MSDLIERQAAIDAVMRNAYNTQRIYEAIKALPPAQPERLKGHWIPLDEDSDEYECDVCRTTYDTVCGTFDLPDFCPHCGADMRGEQE